MHFHKSFPGPVWQVQTDRYCSYSYGSLVELAWCSISVMDCYATPRGLIPGWNGVKT